MRSKKEFKKEDLSFSKSFSHTKRTSLKTHRAYSSSHLTGVSPLVVQSPA